MEGYRCFKQQRVLPVRNDSLRRLSFQQRSKKEMPEGIDEEFLPDKSLFLRMIFFYITAVPIV